LEGKKEVKEGGKKGGRREESREDWNLLVKVHTVQDLKHTKEYISYYKFFFYSVFSEIL
jgi:hypothetical protein